MKLSVPDYILSLKPYVAGKPLEELEREFGIKDAVKLASNENPIKTKNNQANVSI